MNWLEVIQLRSTHCNKDLLETELLELVNENDKITGKQMMMVYSRVQVDTDYTIQIIHKTKNVENNGSPLGLRLVSALKAFGLVNHSIWKTLENNEAGGTKAQRHKGTKAQSERPSHIILAYGECFEERSSM